MDENTKHIVASNLASAFISTANPNRPSSVGTPPAFLVTEDKVMEVYQRFLAKLSQSKT